MWVWLRRLLALLLMPGGVPTHVAFIMDGNRRFADRQRMDEIIGHTHGYSKMVEVIHWCLELGVRYISVYAFSIDNFKRSEREVGALMHLAEQKYAELAQEDGLAEREGLEMRLLGDLSLAPGPVQGAAARLMQNTARLRHKRGVLNICFSYTATEELLTALDALSVSVASSQLHSSDITPQLLHQSLHTREAPPVDLLIRTSGERRLSDFMPWQVAHAHLSFIDRMWPDFSFCDFARSVLSYQRGRRLQAAVQPKPMSSMSSTDPSRADVRNESHCSSRRAAPECDSPRRAAHHSSIPTTYSVASDMTADACGASTGGSSDCDPGGCFRRCSQSEDSLVGTGEAWCDADITACSPADSELLGTCSRPSEPVNLLAVAECHVPCLRHASGAHAAVHAVLSICPQVANTQQQSCVHGSVLEVCGGSSQAVMAMVQASSTRTHGALQHAWLAGLPCTASSCNEHVSGSRLLNEVSLQFGDEQAVSGGLEVREFRQCRFLQEQDQIRKAWVEQHISM